jgi:hypothetical protein
MRQPSIEFHFDGVNVAQLKVRQAMHGKMFRSFPALYGSHVTTEVSGDLFPTV